VPVPCPIGWATEVNSGALGAMFGLTVALAVLPDLTAVRGDRPDSQAVLGSLRDAAHAGKSGWSPADVGHFHGAGEAVKLFDAGSCFEGLRIVATSTRVRLFIFPAGSRG
jgi:hypothetical protein